VSVSALPATVAWESEIDCSVLVPVLNEERYVHKALAAMKAQTYDGQLEFVFADGGSVDRTVEILKAKAEQDPRIRVCANPGRSVTSGLNVALRHARGRWVARMDAHSEYPHDYISLGIRRLQEGGTRWVSGPQVPRGHGPVSSAVAVALGERTGRAGSRKWGTANDADGPEFELDSGVFTGVWKRATLLEYGGWDERWVCNEDSEMAARFLERGERLVCLPAMAAWYSPRNSLRLLWLQYLRYGEYRARTARHHPASLRRSHLVAPALVLAVPAALVGPRPSRRLARIALGFYALALGLEGSHSIAKGQPITEAGLVPAVLATMHFAWGIGTLRGSARFGPPWQAILKATLGRPGLATDAVVAGPVFSPSLSD